MGFELEEADGRWKGCNWIEACEWLFLVRTEVSRGGGRGGVLSGLRTNTDAWCSRDRSEANSSYGIDQGT